MADEVKGPQQLALEAEFPPSQLDSIPKEGKRLTYIPGGEVIQRLNDVLGVTGWEWKTGRIWRDEINSEWVLAYGDMTCTIDGKTSMKSGEGGVEVSLTRKDKTIVDLGDEFKGASTDALKKAAQRFGVGLWLARSKEARAYEAPRAIRDAQAEGWESTERAEQFTKELNARVKAAPEEVQAEMRQFREDNDILWPPTYDGYEVMRRRLDKLLHEWGQLQVGAQSQHEADPNELPGPTLPYEPGPTGRSEPVTGTQPSESPERPSEPSELESPPEPIAKPGDGGTEGAAEKLASAFPGAEDLSPASPELLQTLNDYIDRLTEQGDVRAWNKYAKEKSYPKDRAIWTEAQVRQALDFLETL